MSKKLNYSENFVLSHFVISCETCHVRLSFQTLPVMTSASLRGPCRIAEEDKLIKIQELVQ